jgi:RES domain-containing protein
MRRRLGPRQGNFFVDRATLEQLESVPKVRVRWKLTYRLQLDRYPPVDYFERVANREDRMILDDLEKLTDPAERQRIGQISLVPTAKRVFGKGASSLMGPFTHASKRNPSRFTDGSYGVYYAGRQFETALREVAYHWALFHARTKDESTETTFKVVNSSIDKVMHDIRSGVWGDLLDPDPANYAFPQRFAAQLKDRLSSNGIVYPSVRHPNGECIAAFWPDVVKFISDQRRLALKWDGKAISSWFDFDTGEWAPL